MSGVSMVLQDLQQEVIDLYILFLNQMDKALHSTWSGLKETDIAGEMYQFENEIASMMSISEFNELEREIRNLKRDDLLSLRDGYLKNLDSLEINSSHITSRPARSISDFINEVEDIQVREMLKVVWKHGDEIARLSIVEYLDGESDILFDLDPKEARGKTTRSNGRKVYHLSTDFDSFENKTNLMQSSLILSHEMHRDGLNMKNPEDTRSAVKSDIIFTNSLLQENSYASNILHKNFEMLKQVGRLFGDGVLSKVINRVFSSQADYWKLIENGLEYEKDGFLRKDDRIIQRHNNLKVGANGIEGGLHNILLKVGIDIPQEEVARLMEIAGLVHTYSQNIDTELWSWNASGVYEENVGEVIESDDFNDISTVISAIITSDPELSWLEQKWDSLLSTLENHGSSMKLALNRLHRRFYDAEDSWNAADDVLKNNLQLSDKDKYSDLYASLNAYDEVFMAGGPIEWYRQNITWYNFRDGNTRDISEERPNTAGKWIPINKRMVDKMNDALLDYGGKLAGTTSLTNEQKRLLAYNNINNSMNSDDTPNERFLFANGWGGYNPRFIAGSDTLSFHAFGAALDFDPGNNKQYIFYTDPTNDNQIFQTNVNNLVRAANNNEKVDTVDEFLSAIQRIKDIRADNYDSCKAILISSNDYSGLRTLLSEKRDWDRYKEAINEEILGFEEDFIRSMGGAGFDWGALWHTQLDVMHWQDGNRPEWDEGLESINLYFREQEKPC
ncbi:MAG: hypothetical protein PQJ50_18660 [Spirochaetales bacterium]|nr:hypothetical protein [Spirochaetales bacterium]